MEGVHGTHQDAGSGLRGRRVHLIGIGGSGMQGAAALLLQRGALVTGSDASPFPELGDLAGAGAIIRIGHRADGVDARTDLVVYSAAVPSDNPELTRARELSIPVHTYAELLGELMSSHRGIAIAGTHGKSTTTGLTAYALRQADLDPSFVIGAASVQLGGRAGAGAGPHFVVEACEYNRSFLHFRPHCAAILNLEAEHLDYYRNLDDLVDAFGEFCGHVSPDGLVVVNHEDPTALRAAATAKARIETFGFARGATWRASNLVLEHGCFAFDVLRDETPVFRTRLQIAGLHNVANALAATALAAQAGAGFDSLAAALSTFCGVDRRLSVRAESHGVTIVDDYAHHPTEIRATLQAARARFNPKRLWVVFQPHQYSRTRHLLDGFAESFADADEVLIPNIYSVRDTQADREAVGAADLAARIHARGGRAQHIPGLENVTLHLEQHVRPGDLVVIMGAGDVWKVADGLAERFRRAG